LIRVRIRGISATAISKILLDRGYQIVQASNIIRERFGLDKDVSPADVTVKDADEDELLVLGFYGKADRVYRDLVDSLEYVFQWVSPVGLYSIHVGVVIEKHEDKCLVDLGRVRGILYNCRHNVGDKVVVSVEKAPVKPGEIARLSYRLRIVGEYVSLIHGSTNITVSEHIRDRGKREFLVAVAAAKLIGTGLGLHFRSSSLYAEKEDIEREIDVLKNKLSEVIAKTRETSVAPKEVYEGEFIGLIGITSLAKQKLDEYRCKVVPTIRYHHMLKTYGGVFNELVDFAEKLVEEKPELSTTVANAIEKYLVEKILHSPRVKIIHVKPDGSRNELTPGYFHRIERIEGGFRIVLTRVMRSNGVYDGLGVEKREGDIDYMFIETNKWFLSHNYYRNGQWIGSYININTPPEILPGAIKYHDLTIDIVVKPGSEPEVIDEEEFEKQCNEGLISEKLCRETKEKIREIINNIDKYIYRHEETKL